MQIYCPKCKTGYEIDAAVVPEKGRRLRCAVCGRVFTCLPEDLQDGSKLRTAEFTEEEKQRLDEQGHLQEEVIAEPIKTPEADSEEPKSAESETSNEEPPAQNEPEDSAKTDSPEMEGTGKTLDELAAEAASAGSQDVKDIFERLSKETEALFKAESEEKSVKRCWYVFKKSLGLLNPHNLKYYLISFGVLFLLFMYYARYEIVRTVPILGPVYKVVGIKAYVTGEGLEFQNVIRRDYEEDFVRKFEVKGFIANQTAKSMTIPTIAAELLDEEARTIQAKKVAPTIPLVTAKGKVPFSFIIEKPSPLSKYIYLTFVDGPAD